MHASKSPRKQATALGSNLPGSVPSFAARSLAIALMTPEVTSESIGSGWSRLQFLMSRKKAETVSWSFLERTIRPRRTFRAREVMHLGVSTGSCLLTGLIRVEKCALRCAQHYATARQSSNTMSRMASSVSRGSFVR